MGTNRITKMSRQVTRDEREGFIFRLKSRKTGVNTPVTTAPIMMTEINGHNSHPSSRMEIISSPRKNHRIKSRDVLSVMSCPHRLVLEPIECSFRRQPGVPAMARRRHRHPPIPNAKKMAGIHGKVDKT
jgi:hypothetical protein